MRRAGFNVEGSTGPVVKTVWYSGFDLNPTMASKQVTETDLQVGMAVCYDVEALLTYMDGTALPAAVTPTGGVAQKLAYKGAFDTGGGSCAEILTANVALPTEAGTASTILTAAAATTRFAGIITKIGDGTKQTVEWEDVNASAGVWLDIVTCGPVQALFNVDMSAVDVTASVLTCGGTTLLGTLGTAVLATAAAAGTDIGKLLTSGTDLSGADNEALEWVCLY